MTSHGGRTARLNMRLTPEALAALRDGARASGKSVSSFVIDAALAEASRSKSAADEGTKAQRTD